MSVPVAGRRGARADDTCAVLLAWNDAPRVLGLLDALEACDPRPGHVVVVDNGSRDDTASRVRERWPGHDLVLLGENLGFAAAVNRGLERAIAAEARFAWILNTDLELPPSALGALRAAAEREPRTGLVSAVLLEADGRVQARGGGRVNLWTGASRHVVAPGEDCHYMTGACLLLRTGMLREVGLFDEGYFFYWEDVDLGFRAREAGWTMAVAEDCRVVHHEGSSLGRWSEERWFHLFRGMRRFLHARSPVPRVATATRLLHHSAAMLRHGRHAALRGAWRGAFAGRAS